MSSLGSITFLARDDDHRKASIENSRMVIGERFRIHFRWRAKGV